MERRLQPPILSSVSIDGTRPANTGRASSNEGERNGAVIGAAEHTVGQLGRGAGVVVSLPCQASLHLGLYRRLGADIASTGGWR